MRVQAAAIALVGLACARDVRADDLTQARQRFAAGLELEDAKKWGAALEEFRAVSAVRPTPQVRYHLGLCLEHVGRLVEAAAELSRAEADAMGAADPEQQLVSARAGQLAAKIRARTPRLVPASTLAPPEALRIVVDGEPRRLEHGAAPVDPRTHHVVVELRGAAVVDTSVVAREQDPAQTLVLEPPHAAGGATTSPLVAALPWIAGGVAVAALAGAGVTGLLRSHAISDLDATCGAGGRHCPESARSTFEGAGTLTTATNVLLVTAGVFALATVGLWLGSRPPANAATTVAFRGW